MQLTCQRCPDIFLPMWDTSRNNFSPLFWTIEPHWFNYKVSRSENSCFIFSTASFPVLEFSLKVLLYYHRYAEVPPQHTWTSTNASQIAVGFWSTDTYGSHGASSEWKTLVIQLVGVSNPLRRLHISSPAHCPTLSFHIRNNGFDLTLSLF